MAKKVLIVDDHPQVGDAIAEMLRVMGHTAHHFSSGAIALEWLEGHRPDLALLDLAMPGTNGVDLLVAMREVGHEFPILIITGYPDSALAKEAMVFGAVTIVTKPIAMNDLMELVETI